MTVKSYKMGPGTFTIGAAPQDATCQITNCRIDWTESVSTDDAIPTLCGDEIPAEDEVTYSAVVAGTLVQDIDSAGIVAYSWANKGTEQPFVFIPSTSEARKVTGTLRVVPLTLGGDVKARNTSDFSMAIIGDPDLDDVA